MQNGALGAPWDSSCREITTVEWEFCRVMADIAFVPDAAVGHADHLQGWELWSSISETVTVPPVRDRQDAVNNNRPGDPAASRNPDESTSHDAGSRNPQAKNTMT